MFSGALDTSLNVEHFVCNESTPSTHDVNCQTSNLELFAKIVKNEKPFTIFVITSILDVWKGSEYASELASKVTDVSFLKQIEYHR